MELSLTTHEAGDQCLVHDDGINCCFSMLVRPSHTHLLILVVSSSACSSNKLNEFSQIRWLECHEHKAAWEEIDSNTIIMSSYDDDWLFFLLVATCSTWCKLVVLFIRVLHEWSQHANVSSIRECIEAPHFHVLNVPVCNFFFEFFNQPISICFTSNKNQRSVFVSLVFLREYLVQYRWWPLIFEVRILHSVQSFFRELHFVIRDYDILRIKALFQVFWLWCVFPKNCFAFFFLILVELVHKYFESKFAANGCWKTKCKISLANELVVSNWFIHSLVYFIDDHGGAIQVFQWNVY